MQETRKIAHNTLIQLVGKAVTIVLGLIAFGIITRTLGQEGFGFYTTVYGFLAVFAILVDLGLQMTTAKLISDPANSQSKILSNSLTIRLVASVLFLGVAPIAVLFFPYAPLIKTGVAIAAVGFVFTSLTVTLTSLFQQKLAIYKLVIAEIIAKAVYVGFLITIYFGGYGLLTIIAAQALDTVLLFGILYYFAKKYVTIKPQFDFAIWKKILSHTWPIALTIALNLIYFKGDIIIMSLMRPQAEVGLYGAPYRILEVMINMAYLFLGIILPIMATSVAVKNFGKLKKIIQASFDFLIIATIPLIVGGYFLGRDILILMAGNEFAISGEIIKILLIATGAIIIAALFGYVVVALDKQRQMIKFYAVNAAISIIAYIIVIPRYTYWGAAWVTVFSELFILLTAFYVMQKTLKFSPKLSVLFKATLASLVMAIPLYFLAHLHFAILFLIAIMVYAAALFLFKAISKKNVFV